MKRSAILLLLIVALAAVSAGPARAADIDLYYEANNYYWNGQYTAAIDLYRRILRDYPQTDLKNKLYFSLGSAYHKLEDYQKAQTWYEKLLQEQISDEMRVDAMYHLGDCYLQTGNPQRGGEVLDEVLRRFPASLITGRATVLLDQARAAGYEPGREPGTRPASPAAEPTGEFPPEAVTPPARTVTPPPARTVTPPPARSIGSEQFYTVKPGDSLSTIARDVLGELNRYRELAMLNDLEPPYTISVGQRLRLPGSAATAAPTRPADREPLPARPTGNATPRPEPPATAEPQSGGPQSAQLQRELESLRARLQQLEGERQAGTYQQTATGIQAAQLQRENDQLRRQLATLEATLHGEEGRAIRLIAEGNAVADSLVQSLQRQLAELEPQLTQARESNAALRDQLDRREELLGRTRTGFDELHRSYQEMETKLAAQDRITAAARELSDTVVARMKTMQAALDELQATVARERAASEARVRALTESSDARLTGLNAQVAELTTKLATRDQELRQVQLARDDYELQLNQLASREQETREAVPLTDRGRQLRQAGRYAEAVEAYRQALAKDATNADAMNGLAYLFAELGDSLSEAKTLVARAIDRNPSGKGFYLDTLGWVYYKEANYTQAVATFAQALELLPLDARDARAVVSFHSGLAWLKQGNRDKAFFAFVDTINLAPGSKYAAEAQKYLGQL